MHIFERAWYFGGEEAVKWGFNEGKKIVFILFVIVCICIVLCSPDLITVQPVHMHMATWMLIFGFGLKINLNTMYSKTSILRTAWDRKIGLRITCFRIMQIFPWGFAW
jgi:hypothetical protein